MKYEAATFSIHLILIYFIYIIYIILKSIYYYK
jgi:hypothetical protein